MRIGLTYDLRAEYLAAGLGEEETAEFDGPETIRAIEEALQAHGHETVRIGHLRQLLARLVAGERWELVFNIAEGLYGFGREAQVPAVLDAYRIPYVFSDPLALALTLHKGMAKHIVRDCGVPTPDFAVVTGPADLAGISLPYPLFAKPVAEGTGKGIGAASKVRSARELAATCRTLLSAFGQPVLVETYLPGREFTVGIVGTDAQARSLGVMEVLLGERAEADAYSFANKEHYEERVTYHLERGPLAARVGAVALGAWRALGCRDGGRVDLRLDAAGLPNFLEVNPLAGLNPERSDLVILARLGGMDYRTLIGHILDSALERLAPEATVGQLPLAATRARNGRRAVRAAAGGA